VKRSVTVATLIYKSPDWLRFTLEQLSLAENDCKVSVLVVGNDANTRVMEALPRLHGDFDFEYVDHRNIDPYAYNMGRVYAAHNRCMQEARTQDVILINSDMSYADHWADELLAMRDEFPCVPTSLLIESGRVPSGLPTYVRDFGRHWSTFDRAGFLARAEQIRDGTGRRMAGGLFMPVLFRKSEFFAAGGYEIQERDHVLASDAKLFQKFENEMKLPHVTAVRSVVYHCQRGEMEDDVA
jgi:hypothetical protein